MFQNFLISIVIVPLLFAVSAPNGSGGARRRFLKIGWTSYTVLWFCSLYYLRYRWS